MKVAETLLGIFSPKKRVHWRVVSSFACKAFLDLLYNIAVLEKVSSCVSFYDDIQFLPSSQLNCDGKSIINPFNNQILLESS